MLDEEEAGLVVLENTCKKKLKHTDADGGLGLGKSMRTKRKKDVILARAL